MTDPDFAEFARVARPLLDLVHRLTGLESTFLTRIDWDACEQEVVLALNTGDLETVEGSVVDWTDSMCRVTFLKGQEQLSDILTDYPGSTGAERGMCTFVAVPILKGDDALGTVCGASRRPVQVRPDAIANMRLIAAALSTQLEAHIERLALRDRAAAAEALASVDPRTGLANRRAVTTRYEPEVARSGRHDTPV
ncbi:MAG: GAF domain-containing protein, partial [Actinomycetes bacterium]